MYDRVYRGTTLDGAMAEEFGRQAVVGREIELFEGFMDPEDIRDSHSGSHVEDLPWDQGPRRKTVGVTGGFSNRMGVAQSFGGVVFHLNRNRLPHLMDVHYDYQFYNDVEGAMAWVDGTAGGELRINESLEGMVNPNGEGNTIRYYGDEVRSRARAHNEEMEMIATGNATVDISNGTEAVAVYVTRPKATLSNLDGYVSFGKYADEDETVIEDWDDERAAVELSRVVGDAVPGEWPSYVFHTTTHLAMESWGFDDSYVESVYARGDEVPDGAYPDWLLGE